MVRPVKLPLGGKAAAVPGRRTLVSGSLGRYAGRTPMGWGDTMKTFKAAAVILFALPGLCRSSEFDGGVQAVRETLMPAVAGLNRNLQAFA